MKTRFRTSSTCEGDVAHAAEMLLEDMDWSDPAQEAHFYTLVPE